MMMILPNIIIIITNCHFLELTTNFLLSLYTCTDTSEKAEGSLIIIKTRLCSQQFPVLSSHENCFQTIRANEHKGTTGI